MPLDLGPTHIAIENQWYQKLSTGFQGSSSVTHSTSADATLLDRESAIVKARRFQAAPGDCTLKSTVRMANGTGLDVLHRVGGKDSR